MGILGILDGQKTFLFEEGTRLVIELLDASGNRITIIQNVVNPVREFELFYKELYGAVSWRECAPDPEPAPPQPTPPTTDELALALTDVQLKLAEQQELIDCLAVAVTDLQLGGV